MTDEEIAGIRANIQRYNGIGIDVHFTEMDVKCPLGESWIPFGK